MSNYPDGCHCATCTCAPGMTPAIRFDASPAEREGTVRDQLIAMGWTPPQQPHVRGGKGPTNCYPVAHVVVSEHGVSVEGQPEVLSALGNGAPLFARTPLPRAIPKMEDGDE